MLCDTRQEMNRVAIMAREGYDSKTGQKRMVITSTKAAALPIHIGFKDKVYELQPEGSKEFRL